MRVDATDEARDLIREGGGSLYVWYTDHRCCGGRLTLLDASTAAPRARFEFQPIAADGFTVFLDPGRRGLPAELVLEIRGIRRKRIEAFLGRVRVRGLKTGAAAGEVSR